jgi:molecular chaperone GrpE
MLRVGGRLALSLRHTTGTKTIAPVSSRLFFFSSTTTPNEPGDKPAEDGAAKVNNAAQEEVDKLMKENKELKEKLLRSYAEEENVRRIAKRDVDNAKAYANSSFAKSLLDVADNLERAMDAVPADSAASTDPVIKNLLVGVKMTSTDLLKVFDKFGVIRYGAIGDVFDPTVHEALFQIPDSSRPEGSIGQVLKVGYKLKDRVLRAAEVGTVVAPPAQSTTPSS